MCRMRMVAQLLHTFGRSCLTPYCAPSALQEILPEFFRNFWVRRMALDRRNYRQLVETTVTIAQKVGCSQIVGRIVEDLKDESEPYRRMVMETIDKVFILPSPFSLCRGCSHSLCRRSWTACVVEHLPP